MASTQWMPSKELPIGPIWWRLASVDVRGHQGPWSDVQEMRFVPAPGPADLGQSAISFDAGAMHLRLHRPSAGQHYEFTLGRVGAANALRRESADGSATFPRGAQGEYRLTARLVDNTDGTVGPTVGRTIDVPSRYPYLWGLLVPLLFAL